MAGISPAMTREYKETLVVPQFELTGLVEQRQAGMIAPCMRLHGLWCFSAFNGSRAYARCRDVWHIPRHGMGHAEQRRPLPRSCKRYSRMHVVARWPHRELHRAVEKFKLRRYPTISTTISQNPNGAVIRRCLRECGRFATWLDICVTVWLRYW